MIKFRTFKWTYLVRKGLYTKDDDIEYWATDLLDMKETDRDKLGGYSWKIEEYHRGIKQFCGVENCQARISQS
jgi:putative transposase